MLLNRRPCAGFFVAEIDGANRLMGSLFQRLSFFAFAAQFRIIGRFFVDKDLCSQSEILIIEQTCRKYIVAIGQQTIE